MRRNQGFGLDKVDNLMLIQHMPPLKLQVVSNSPSGRGESGSTHLIILRVLLSYISPA